MTDNKVAPHFLPVFWGEIAPCPHLLRKYPDEELFLNLLEDFADKGLIANEGVVIIAIGRHLQALETRLRNKGYNLRELKAKHHYTPIHAEGMVKKLMVKNWPDEQRFRQTVTNILEKVDQTGGRIRVFGETVAMMWTRGLSGATVRMDHLWDHLIHEEGWNLFCVFPKSGLTQDPHLSLKAIRESHTLIRTGKNNPVDEVFCLKSPSGKLTGSCCGNSVKNGDAGHVM